MKTIFNTYILLTEGQEQADRLKKICIDNGLPIWKYKAAFSIYFKNIKPVFCFFKEDYEFFVCDFEDFNKEAIERTYTQVTESEWLELLEEYKLTLK